MLNKKEIFVFYKIFKLDFIMQIIYFIIHSCLYYLFILFLFSVSKKQNIQTMLTPTYYSWQKFKNKMNEKRNQGYQSMNPEYVTGYFGASFEMILSLHFGSILKILIHFSLIKCFPNDHKRYSSHL